MKVKTSELAGRALDWVVAKLEGVPVDHPDYVWKIGGTVYRYSTDWAQGGPIIEREKIAVAYEPSLVYDDSCRWKALCAMNDNGHEYGPTPLIAAMRCYVMSELGDEVDVPDELMEEGK